MPVQLTKHGFPAELEGEREGAKELDDLTLGLHKGRPPALLPPGYTPEARNFHRREGGIEPRSGISSFTTFNIGEAVLGGLEVADFEGTRFAFQFSSLSVAMGDPNLTEYWSELSYIGTDPLSGTSFDYFQATNIFDITTSESLVVFTNGENRPKLAIAGSGTTTYSDFTFMDASFDTLASVEVVETVNDRLVAANVVSSSDTRFPNRILYSQRGNPKNFVPGVAAGFFDLVAMKGPITAIQELEDRAYLFSAEEVWEMEATFDFEAFRASKLVAEVGTRWFNTIRETPRGIIFLDKTFDLYLITPGGQLRNLGIEPGGKNSRIREYLRKIATDQVRMWAAYDARDNTYKLFFATLGSATGFPDRALYVSLDNFSIFEQRFAAHELTFGFPLTDPDTITTYLDIEGILYEDLGLTYADLTDEGEGIDIAAWASTGSDYRFVLGFGTDDGTPIDARWRSSNFGSPDPEMLDTLQGVWIEYESDSASSLTVRLSRNAGDDFLQEHRLPTQAKNHGVLFVPTRLVGEAPIVELQTDGEVKLNLNRMVAKRGSAGRFRNG